MKIILIAAALIASTMTVSAAEKTLADEAFTMAVWSGVNAQVCDDQQVATGYKWNKIQVASHYALQNAIEASNGLPIQITGAVQREINKIKEFADKNDDAWVCRRPDFYTSIYERLRAPKKDPTDPISTHYFQVKKESRVAYSALQVCDLTPKSTEQTHKFLTEVHSWIAENLGPFEAEDFRDYPGYVLDDDMNTVCADHAALIKSWK